MASDEKKIRVTITGDATGLGKEIDRVQADTKDAFKDLGLDSVLEDADAKFTNIRDKIKAINEALKEQHDKANQVFDERSGKASNDFGRKKVESDRNEYSGKEQQAWEKWNKLADALLIAMNRKKIDEEGNPIDPNPLNPPNPKNPRSAQGKASLWARMMQRVMGGNVTGAAHEGLTGEGGLVPSMGMGMSGTMVVGAVATAVASAIALAVKKGLDEVRIENKLTAKVGLDYDKFGNDPAINNLGYSRAEFKEFAVQQMQSMRTYDMGGQQIENELKQRLFLKSGYGLQDGQVSALDQFKQQDRAGGNSTQLIADILLRSEKAGILGVSGSDFSLLPQKIEQVAGLLDIQKKNGEKVDSNTAIGLLMAGQGIGGRFGDDRASEAFGRIDGSIKSPSAPGMKAYIYEMLRRANPNASYTDILGQQENGASADNLKAILPQLANMQKGEYRRMILYQFTKNWQDAIRLDNTDGAEQMLKGLNSKRSGAGEIAGQLDKAKSRGEELTDVFKSGMAKVETAVTKVGTDIVRSIDELSKSDKIIWSSNGLGIPMPVPVSTKPKVIDKKRN